MYYEYPHLAHIDDTEDLDRNLCHFAHKREDSGVVFALFHYGQSEEFNLKRDKKLCQPY